MKLPLFLTTLAVSLFLLNTANAQTDSTHYDLGRILVNKNFTQGITVKAADIERYQFNNITDALKVFFNGTFTYLSTNASSVVYVIDGNIVNDVNAYSIHDVEEITLVQNALGQVSGAAPSQQMILIKTRRGGPGKKGVIVSDQTSFVNARNNQNLKDPTLTTGLYEQLYAGAYKNFTNADIGFSADYMRDVYPDATSNQYTFFDPFHLNRLRLNAYADTRLWKGTTLNFGIDYAPQVANEAYAFINSTASTQTEIAYKAHISQHIFNTNAALHSHIVGGLNNTFSAVYNHYKFGENDMIDELLSEPSSGYSAGYYTALAASQKASTLLLKDNIAYHQAIGNWNIDPSVNFMYRHVNDTLGITQATYQDSVTSPSQRAAQTNKANFKLSLLTPSVNIYYKNILDIQGGFVAILNKENFGTNYPVQRTLPFVSGSLNISEMAELQNVKLSVFGSFSQQNNFLVDPYVTLSGFVLQGFVNNIAQYNGSTPVAFSNYNFYQTYSSYQAGFVLGLGKNFSIDYNFSKNYDATPAEFAIPQGGNGLQLEDFYERASMVTNRIGLNYTVRSGNLNWLTGLNATELKLQLTDATTSPQINQYLGTGHRWTGGFTNRATYKDFFGGFDILYQVGQRPYSLAHWQPADPLYVAPSGNNSFSLQSLYLGKKLKINNLKYAEVYINTRNILQNNSSNITDEHRYYGAGFKFGL